MDHVPTAQLFLEVTVHGGDQVVDFRLIRRHILGPALIGDVGGADQRLVPLIGVDEDHPLVVVLHQVGVVPVPEFRDDDMAALDQPHVAGGVRPGDPADHVHDPGPGAVDKAAGAEGPGLARQGVFRLNRPGAILAPGRGCGGAGQDPRPPFGSVERVQDDKAGIVDPAVGIFEAARVLIQQRRPFRVTAQVERAGPGQFLAPAEVVVQKQAQPHQPGRAVLRRMRQHEAHRPDDMRGRCHQDLTLDQRLAHQAELVIFQIAQPAMDQLAGAGGRPLGQIVLFAQHHRQAAPGRVAGHAGAVDAAADHEKVDQFGGGRHLTLLSRAAARRPMRPMPGQGRAARR